MILGANTVVAGRFRLNRLLGRGGMGSVWHATHLGLDVPCAVKFIEGELAGTLDAQARFEREAKSAAQLRSPHVVQVIDHGVWEGTPYIAMELLEGEDLGSRLRRVGRIAPRDIVRITEQVGRALTKAHGSGIIHRDLKPDNIFLVPDDDREIAKVLDFGIAKTGTDLVSGTTKTGAMLGTPYYMSPEQAQGTKAIDARADLWSMGVIVFECVTGVRPFDSEALGDLLVKIIISPLPVPSLLVNAPPRFDAWWRRAAAREPAERFQSAKELSDALAVALADAVPVHSVSGSGLSAAGGSAPAEPPVWRAPTESQGGMRAGTHTPAPTPGGGITAPLALGTPAPAHGATPAPVHGAPAGRQAFAATTGGAVSRTFGGAAPTPRGGRGPLVAIAGAVSLVLIVGAGITVALRKSEPAPAFASPASASPGVEKSRHDVAPPQALPPVSPANATGTAPIAADSSSVDSGSPDTVGMKLPEPPSGPARQKPPRPPPPNGHGKPPGPVAVQPPKPPPTVAEPAGF
jgi:hypothetical protein